METYCIPFGGICWVPLEEWTLLVSEPMNREENRMPVPGPSKTFYGESPAQMILLIFAGKSYGPGGPKKLKKCPSAGTGTKILVPLAESVSQCGPQPTPVSIEYRKCAQTRSQTLSLSLSACTLHAGSSKTWEVVLHISGGLKPSRSASPFSKPLVEQLEAERTPNIAQTITSVVKRRTCYKPQNPKKVKYGKK